MIAFRCLLFKMRWIGLMAVMVAIVEGGCEIDKSVTSPTDWNLQMNELKRLDSIMGKRSQDLTTVKGTKYQFSVCGDVTGARPKASLVALAGNRTVVLGLYNRTIVANDDGRWLMLTMLGGDKYDTTCGKEERKAHVMFVCDPYEDQLELHSVESSVDIDNSCYFLFVMRHKAICMNPHQGLSGGSILLILLLVTFGCYFLFGFFYNRLVRGAKGVEQIPNRAFWFRVGNMCADGCGAVCRCDQYCGGGQAAPSSYDGYSPIEERMAQDLQHADRDSALLSP